MKLIIKLLLFYILNMTYCIIPSDFDDLKNKEVVQYKMIVINSCRELITLSKNIEKPFYIKLQDKDNYKWFEIYAFEKPSLSFNFNLSHKSWSQLYDKWLVSDTVSRCSIYSDSITMEVFPYNPEVAQFRSGYTVYKTTAVNVSINKLIFYVKYKLKDTIELKNSKALDGDSKIDLERSTEF